MNVKDFMKLTFDLNKASSELYDVIVELEENEEALAAITKIEEIVLKMQRNGKCLDDVFVDDTISGSFEEFWEVWGKVIEKHIHPNDH